MSESECRKGATAIELITGLVFLLLFIPVGIWGGSGRILIFIALMILQSFITRKAENRKNFSFGLGLCVVSLAFLATGILQSVGGMTHKELLSVLDLSNSYDLAIRCTWLVAWLVLTGLDFVFTKSSFSFFQLLKSLLKNMWVLLPFVLLAFLSQHLQIQSPLYRAFRLDRVE